MNKRTLGMGAGFVVLALIPLGAWFIRPLSDRNSSYTVGDNVVQESETRRFDLLPISSWGFGRQWTIGCGKSGSTEIRSLKLGCMTITDTHRTTITPKS